MTNMSSSSSDVSLTRLLNASSPSSPHSDRDSRQLQMRKSIRSLEQYREGILHSSKLIGKPTTSNVAAVNYPISLRRVNFRWQRGIKIGTFHFAFYLDTNGDSDKRQKLLEIHSSSSSKKRHICQLIGRQQGQKQKR